MTTKRKPRARKLTPAFLQESAALLRAATDLLAVLQARHPSSMPLAICVQQLAGARAEMPAAETSHQDTEPHHATEIHHERRN